MKSWLISSTTFLLTCCTAWAGDGLQAPLDVSYCQLAKDPSAWTGKRIRVRAIYHYGFEFSRLESPVCCQEGGPKIWLEIGSEYDGRSERLLHKLDKVGMGYALVVFAGRFEGGSGAMGEKFHLVLDKIENLEKTVKAVPKSKLPRWVPQGCKAAAQEQSCPGRWGNWGRELSLGICCFWRID